MNLWSWPRLADEITPSLLFAKDKYGLVCKLERLKFAGLQYARVVYDPNKRGVT